MRKTTMQLERSLPHELEFVDGDYSYIVKVTCDRWPNRHAQTGEYITVTLARYCQGKPEEAVGFLEVRRVE